MRSKAKPEGKTWGLLGGNPVPLAQISGSKASGVTHWCREGDASWTPIGDEKHLLALRASEDGGKKKTAGGGS